MLHGACRIFALGVGLSCVAHNAAAAQAQADGSLPDWLSVHGQITALVQYYPSFRSPFEGPNSLQGRHQAKETADATLYAGVRLWDGLELYVNPEIDQGFGLSDTLGLAGFSSGEAYKVGRANPYFRLQRAFIRYTIGLRAEKETVADAANQVSGTRQGDNIVITAGKLSATDIFDTNAYAHDPRGDFFNWSIVDSGAYDYAADAWGYSYGIAAEWTQAWWTIRAGLFDLSTIPNTTTLETDFRQFELVTEFEARHEVFSQPGKIKLLAFANRGRMASYRDALTLATATGTTPDAALVRKYRTRPGAALNVEQGITNDFGAFLRLSANDGAKEAFEFTEINKSAAAGIALKGASWGRDADTIGLAGVVNDISQEARQYFAAGGLGILIGDGELPRKGTENILETYYRASLTHGVSATVDYQFISHPAYNAARGPVHILGFRLHAEL
jgi:high affinity Mn2+ porin